MAQLFQSHFSGGGESWRGPTYLSLTERKKKKKRKFQLSHQQPEHPSKVHGIIFCQLLYTILAWPFINSISFKGE